MKFCAFLLATVWWIQPLLAQADGQGIPEPGSLPITVSLDRTADIDLFGFSQDVVVRNRATVNADVGSIAGNIFVHGKINGNISVLAGSVYLFDTAEVTGTIVCIGGKVHKPANLEVKGKIINYFSSDDASGNPWLYSAKSHISYYFFQCLFLFCLAFAIFYIFPNQVTEASFQLSQELIRPLVFGAIAMAVFVLAMFTSFLLMVILIGFPLFLLLLGAYAAIAAFGVAVILHRFGTFVANTSKGRVSLLWGMLLMVLIATLAVHVPVLNVAVVLAVLVLGSGVVIETRFGTEKHWFTQRKRYWSA